MLEVSGEKRRDTISNTNNVINNIENMENRNTDNINIDKNINEHKQYGKTNSLTRNKQGVIKYQVT